MVVEIVNNGKNNEEDVNGDKDDICHQFWVGEVEAASDAKLVDWEAKG